MSSHERQTVDGIISSFNAMDIDTIIALRTPECQRVFLPSSLNYPPQSNDAYRANLLGMKSIFTSFHLEVTDLVEGTDMNGQKKIVVYLNAKGNTPVGEYKNEYVWKMGFDEQGFKVSSWEEYVDVGMTRDFYPKLRDEMVKRAQAGK